MEKLTIEQLQKNYKISENGDVYSNKRMGSDGRILKQFLVKGYYRVSIWINGKFKVKQIHRLVAECFIPNPENKPYVNHKDGNKLNNHVSNLEWCTAKENSQHAHDNGLAKSHMRPGGLNKRNKIVRQYSLSGVFIKEHESFRMASIETGACLTGISYCVNNKTKQSGGFIWKTN